MKSVRHTVLFLVAAVLGLSAFTAIASDPVGVYTIVEKVIFEPNDKNPQRVQVWGAFAIATPPGDAYTSPARGYMYFTAAPGQEATAKMEWADLKSVAGTGQGVAFGGRYTRTGNQVEILRLSVRRADAKPENPDIYPMANGVTKVNPATGYQPNMNKVIDELAKLLKRRT